MLCVVPSDAAIRRFQVLARRMIAPPLVLRGELQAARRHLEEIGAALYDPTRDRDSASRLRRRLQGRRRRVLGQATFPLGYPDQALAFAREARAAPKGWSSTSIGLRRSIGWL